jgi:hypothetical protein
MLKTSIDLRKRDHWMISWIAKRVEQKFPIAKREMK